MTLRTNSSLHVVAADNLWERYHHCLMRYCRASRSKSTAVTVRKKEKKSSIILHVSIPSVVLQHKNIAYLNNWQRYHYKSCQSSWTCMTSQVLVQNQTILKFLLSVLALFALTCAPVFVLSLEQTGRCTWRSWTTPTWWGLWTSCCPSRSALMTWAWRKWFLTKTELSVCMKKIQSLTCLCFTNNYAEVFLPYDIFIVYVFFKCCC